MRKGGRHRRTGGLAAALVAVLISPGLVSAETITVNGTGDSVADDGNCVLREAIQAANDNAATGSMAGECAAGEAAPAVRDLIEFGLGLGTHVISPIGSDLPAVTEKVEIDGSNGTALPRIEIDGSAAGAGGTGLFITTGSDGSYIHDLAIHSFTADGLNLFSGSNEVERVISGMDLAGMATTLGNDSDGIQVSGDGNVIHQVVASANAANGINVEAGADTTTITGSRIGTNIAGTLDAGNGLSGIRASSNSSDGPDSLVIGGPTGLTPGGACSGDCNLISGNGIHGIDLLAAGLPITGAEIRGNHIGSDDAGTADLGNAADGIVLQANLQGTAIEDNLISGNGDDGITLSTSSSATVTLGPADAVIAGNRIGVVSDGSAALANGDRGITAISDVTSGFDPIAGTVIGGATGLTAGGACSGDCNVISGNGTFGIDLFGNVDGTQVLGNHVGIDGAGAAAVANGQTGLSVTGAESIQVGEPGAGNVVSGNVFDGVRVTDTEGPNAVQANLIGVGSDGSGTVPNGDNGVSLFTSAEHTLVGGTGVGEGNVIADNAGAGVDTAGGVAPAADNAILGNSIFANGGIGIDHGAVLAGADGVTANDGPGDADAGGNGLQNFPELQAAFAGSSTMVLGRLEGAPSTTFRIEVFAGDDADPSGFGEGETILGSFEVTTDAGGTAAVSQTVAGIAGPGQWVSATATELDGQGGFLATSEFGLSVSEGACDVTGTPGDDPALAGTSADEVICGLGGDDVIDGGGGDDAIVGGAGTDEVDYSAAAAEIEADLESGAITGPGAGLDLVAEVEDVRGSDFDDTIIGDEFANFVQANDGKDTVEGGDGDDTLKGGIGGDTLKGGDGGDELLSQDGGDELRGQSGSDDDLSAGPGKDNLNGGGGSSDHCNGGGNTDDTPAPGCESTASIP